MLQKILEKPLEKKAGRNYGPPAGKTLIYFIDDINMPEASYTTNVMLFLLLLTRFIQIVNILDNFDKNRPTFL